LPSKLQRRALVATIAVAALSVAPSHGATAAIDQSGVEYGTLQADDSEPAPPGEPYFGQERITGKYVPDDLTDEPRRLVILLHGYGQSTSGVLRQIPLLEAAYENGWILVVPTGLSDSRSNPYWSATATCCDINARRNDDVGYLRSVIQRHLERYPVDRNNVTVVGLSNGAFMAYQLACEASDLVGGIVAISGVEGNDATDCTPRRPVSIYHIHGLFDRAVFFSGGIVGVKPERFAPYPSASATVGRWADRNSCPTDNSAPVSVPRGEGGQWLNCEDRTVVQYRWLPDSHGVAITDELLGSIVDFISAQNRDLPAMR
jgi:polyhydroxybutyrate depolymerase